MRLTSKGQVTIPSALRQRYGLNARTEVIFEAAAGGVLIKPVPDERVRALKAGLKKVRGSADAGLTTEEIMRQTRTDED